MRIGRFTIALIALVGCLFASCDGSGDGSDSNTNWLGDCTRDGDCDGADRCLCGLCTRSCSGSDECAEGKPAVCFETVGGGGDCRLGVGSAAGVCLPVCEEPSDCPGATSCIGAVCLPSSAAQQAVTDAGAGAGGIGAGGASAGGGVSSVSGAFAGNGGGVPKGGSAPLPEPIITGGLPDGERPPQQGEVAPNAYGSPSAPPGAQYSSGSMEGCEDGLSMWPGPDPCFVYKRCAISCSTDQDCPAADSGEASPTCLLEQCELACDDGTPCPTGMSCLYVDGVGTCWWSADHAYPDCATWCELDPLPQDCPGWCALDGVGCNPSETGYCCDGLVCGPRGFCVEAP